MADYYARRAAEYERVFAKPERQSDLRAMEVWLGPIFASATFTNPINVVHIPIMVADVGRI